MSTVSDVPQFTMSYTGWSLNCVRCAEIPTNLVKLATFLEYKSYQHLLMSFRRRVLASWPVRSVLALPSWIALHLRNCLLLCSRFGPCSVGLADEPYNALRRCSSFCVSNHFAPIERLNASNGHGRPNVHHTLRY